MPKRHITYNYCQICGYTPQTEHDEPNWAPIRWWDPDDGWRIGSLCRCCIDEFGEVKPKPDDYAWEIRDEFCPIANQDTDEDPADVL